MLNHSQIKRRIFTIIITLAWLLPPGIMPVWAADSAMVKSISPSTLAEDYAEDTYIIIKGSWPEDDNIEVYFNDTEARRVVVRTDNETASLKVYLPTRSRQLAAGSYTVRILSDAWEQVVYDGLSIVPRAELPAPSVEGRISQETRYGDIVTGADTSACTLELRSRYQTVSQLTLDLDELMGSDVMMRSIILPRDFDAGTLSTYSYWGDVTLYGVREKQLVSGDPVLGMGRISSYVQSARTRYFPLGLARSDFFEVHGQNLTVVNYVVRLPFSAVPGEDIRVIHYDEELRRWSELECAVDWVNGWVTIPASRWGIFVAVGS